MRRYDDPVEVRKGMVPGAGGAGGGARAVPLAADGSGRSATWSAHWVETGPWWQSREVAPVLGGEAGQPERPGLGARPVAEREVWRVEAARGLAATGAGPRGLRPGLRLGPGQLAADPVRWTERSAAMHRSRAPRTAPSASTSRPRPSPTSSGRRPPCGRRSPAPTSGCATPMPTWRRSGRPRRCWPPGPGPPPAVTAAPAAAQRLGAARRGGAGVRRVGDVLLRRCGASGPRRRPGPGAR